MSQENVELVRRVYEGWIRGDFTDTRFYDPDIEFEMPDWPNAEDARGLQAMNDAWRNALAAWQDFRAEPQEFIEWGDHVIALNHIHAWGKESGVEVSADTATVWTFRNGKVTKLALHWNVERAFASVGLERPEQDSNLRPTP